MSNSATSPFNLVSMNVNLLSHSILDSWQALVQAPDYDTALPSTPLLYALVETGHNAPRSLRDWSVYHLPGSAPPPKKAGKPGSGGISLLYHTDCPISVLPAYSLSIDPTPSPTIPASSALVCAIVRPRHRAPFLLAVVYLQPQRAKDATYISLILDHIETASDCHPTLPLLVVGDFNCHHTDWHCPMAISSPATSISSAARHLASWIENSGLDLANPLGMVTRAVIGQPATDPQRSVIDLVFSSPDLVSGITQRHQDHLRTDHIPFTIELSLISTIPAPRGPPPRGRVTWDHHREAEYWQQYLPSACTAALAHLLPPPSTDPLLLPIPPSTTPQALLDSIYDEFEQLLSTTCLNVVGTKEVRPTSAPWLSFPGIQQARLTLQYAYKAFRTHPTDNSLRSQLHSARTAWRKVSREAKRQTYTELCEQVMVKDCKLRWSMFKRASPSQLSSMASIIDPITKTLPVDHAASLDNLCTAFVEASKPPPPTAPSAYASIVQQVTTWADPSHPSFIPPHPSDSWVFTCDDVKSQCTRQYSNTAPGPDTILPAFLKHAGATVWTILAHLFTFSWTHSVTPQAWKSANVMALYKGAGDKSSAGSYRPISMTSIIVRTFEHLIQRLLAEELEERNYFAPAQFGFRKGRSTHDAIYSLHSSIQRVMRTSTKGDTLQCPVLFLDIQKAFDRVDHAILLHRVHHAGITGKAWLWIRSFLSTRRMRCVDASECSNWMNIQYGVPQGCVLSPLLFLIFINDLQRTIAEDTQCELISPTFFADDGAIGPHPKKPLGATESYPSRYLAALTRSIVHLNEWCETSRMCFGKAKTQIVVFTTRMQPDPTPYSSLSLCGFTIDIATEYKYLGVLLTQRLTWTRHVRYAIQQARKASSQVTRVILRARAHIHFTAVRALVLGYVVPSYSYGILFWGRYTTLAEVSARTLQAAAATPLRVCLQLPTTTHQLSVLEMCNIPTVASLALTAQLSFLSRVESADFPPTHPTRTLHTASVDSALKRTGSCKHAGPVLLPAVALNTSVFIGVSVYPPLCSDSSIVSALPSASLPPLQLPPPLGSGLGREYWEKDSATRLTWSPIHFPYGPRPTPTFPTFQGLRAILQWSRTSAPGLSRPLIRQLRQASAHNEWKRQHLPATHPVGTPPPRYSTDCPMTRCKASSGLAPFLHHLSQQPHSHQVTRARLLLGRSRTGAVLHRFAKPADAASTTPHCPHCSTALHPVLDDISHVLLDCTRYSLPRSQMVAGFNAAPALPLPVPLSLSTVLVASIPPPLLPDHPFPSSLLPRLLRLTSTFFGAVAHLRVAIGLPHLDTG